MNYKSNFNVKPCAISSGFVEFERDVVYPELVKNKDFSDLGAELTTPFNSGWLKLGENNWSLNPAPVFGGIEGIDATSYVYQGISTTIGKQYQVVVDASVTEGSCELRGFNTTTILTISTLGRKTYSAIFTETDGNNNVGFNSASGFTGVIHSLSVKEINLNWDEVGNSSLVVGDYEGKTNVANINILGTANSDRIKQDFDYVDGVTYFISVEVYLVSGNIRIDTANSVVPSDFINNSTTGSWQTLTANFTAISSSANQIWLRSSQQVSQFYVSSISVTEVGEPTESALPNQAECEAYGYTWNSGNRTCQAFNPSITLETIAGNLSNYLYGSNNKTQRGTQNSMTIGQGNSINGITENNLIVGRGNSIKRETANNFIVGTAAKSIVDNSFSLGGNNGVADRLDRLGTQLVSEFDFLLEGSWSLSENASIEYEKLVLNGSGASVFATQSLYASGVKNGKTLRFIYEVSENTLVSDERSRTQGLLRVGANSNSLFPSIINLNSNVGTHTFDVIVGVEGSNNIFDIDITSDYISGNIKINYVTIQEVLPFIAPIQMSYLMFGKQTTDGTTKAANLNNTAGTFYVVPLNSASYFQCDIVAVRTGGTSRTGAIGDTASWTEKGVFTNLNQAEGGLTISRERDTVQSIGSGTTNWRPTAVVNNTNGNFGLNVRGATDMIIEWAITVRITQIKTTF